MDSVDIQKRPASSSTQTPMVTPLKVKKVKKKQKKHNLRSVLQERAEDSCSSVFCPQMAVSIETLQFLFESSYICPILTPVWVVMLKEKVSENNIT